ncbi:phosphogluconate dehydrogenase [Citrobacter koseri]|uniref:Phosphogluconate dehydrogenase n=1 Tax=Citrobacter koseri TaxID=545 RepID=A0A2X2WM07_CITKO|nr:phosphogluconate dehydrogenase [Citrobacter koseri]
MAVIAFVGLGQMGSPMASNLLKQGHQLSVFDVNPDAIQTLVEKGARPASSPAQAAKEAEFVITMLPNGDLVRSVLFGDQGVCEGLSQDALVIDMSTIHPLQTDKLIADMCARGFSMMDVPVGRTSDHAIAGTLLLLAGGSAEQVERATPVLMAMGNELINAGGPGMGIRVKLINNYMRHRAECAFCRSRRVMRSAGPLLRRRVKSDERNPGRQRPLHHLLAEQSAERRPFSLLHDRSGAQRPGDCAGCCQPTACADAARRRIP